ncbi:hypothetical protein K1T71_000333 [Dendrolimus kikuchii]|uniref:Uncharacterized protein n=1 Tax=Dendrolimus kikuchii TaxID=765133 RepID=A0ACC1DJD5_9NEOP|nr:hypothetical protein K1T71_000333 [Dendrolimus kikuchii]
MDNQIQSTSTSTMPDDGSDGVNQVNTVVYPLILTGEKYFTVINSGNSNEHDNVQASCIQCKAIIKGNLKATSNFRLHLKRKHPDVLNDYENDKLNQHVSGKRKVPLKHEDNRKQTKLNFTLRHECVQINVRKNLTKYYELYCTEYETLEYC